MTLILLEALGALVLLLLAALWRPLLAITVHEELAMVEGLPVAGLRMALIPMGQYFAFAVGAARDIELICANPDRVVQRGDQLIYCGGSLADLYESQGGRVVMAGKPFAPTGRFRARDFASFAVRSEQTPRTGKAGRQWRHARSVGLRRKRRSRGSPQAENRAIRPRLPGLAR